MDEVALRKGSSRVAGGETLRLIDAEHMLECMLKECLAYAELSFNIYSAYARDILYNES